MNSFRERLMAHQKFLETGKKGPGSYPFYLENENVDLSAILGMDLTGVQFDNVRFTGSAQGYVLDKCSFRICAFDNVDLRAISMKNAVFQVCVLNNVNLKEVSMHGACFEHCCLYDVLLDDNFETVRCLNTSVNDVQFKP